MDALPEIINAVGSAIPVLIDSGIRSGSDAFKAIALGATAVCIGRPYVYGLAIAGQLGVEEVLRNFMAEFELTMALSGCDRIDTIHSDCLTVR
jgi:lactate 2-monooxygenase